MVLFEAPPTMIPTLRFPEITFLAAAEVPPIVFPEPPFIKIPRWPFATAAVPAAFVPMKFPCTMVPPEPWRCTPSVLPEITFPGQMVVAEALPLTKTPSFELPRSVIPSVPSPT